jgi:hypothetical protein
MKSCFTGKSLHSEEIRPRSIRFPAPVFPGKNPGSLSDVNFELKEILADNPLGLLLIAIKGKCKIQNLNGFFLLKPPEKSGQETGSGR